MSARRIDDGGPAFPEAGLSGLPNGDFIYGNAGMTLRAYFAANALSIIAADADHMHVGAKEYAAAAVEIADALIAELRQVSP